MSYVSARQFAKIFDVSVSHVYNLIRDGEIKAVKLGHIYRIPKSEIDKCGALNSTEGSGAPSPAYREELSAVRQVPQIVELPSGGLTNF